MGLDRAMAWKPDRRTTLRWAVLCNLGYAAALLVGAVVPRVPGVIRGVPSPDTLAHAAAYGLQAVLLLWLLGVWRAGASAWVALAAWSAASLYGLGTELLQTMLPTRSAELSDLVADAIGAAAAVLVVKLVFRPAWARQASGGD